MDFALIHQAFLVIVKEFDRVLDLIMCSSCRYYLPASRRKRRGLARSVGPVTSTRPRACQTIPSRCGSPEESKFLISQGKVRNTAPTGTCKQVAAKAS